jgi:hypothetical protein
MAASPAGADGYQPRGAYAAPQFLSWHIGGS